MNTTLSRIAMTAPAIAAIIGFGIGAAHAAPMEINDHNQVQPEPDWSDVFAADVDSDDPEDAPDGEPADPPADEPAEEPTDEPTEDDSDDPEASEESTDDEASDEESDNTSRLAPAFETVATSKSSDGEESSADDTGEAYQTTAAELTPRSQASAGVQVPVAVLAAGGAMVAGVAAWAGYRRHRIFTS